MRYTSLDQLRGITLISMIGYHLCWDLYHLYGVDLTWFTGPEAYIWQQSICWCFILLSGYCLNLGKHPIRRGIIVLLAGFLVELVTEYYLPENAVKFGILTLIGSSMILTALLRKILAQKKGWLFIISILLFVLTRECASGWLGFESYRLVELPDLLSRNLFTTYLGFPMVGFSSTDYFPLIPWFFLFLTGFSLYPALPPLGASIPGFIGRILTALGRHSLIIYLLHQPVLYVLLNLIFLIINA